MVKKFRFKLEALISKRRHNLELVQKSLHKIRIRLREEQKKVQIIESKIAEVTADYGEVQRQGNVHSDVLLRYVSFLRDLKMMLAQQQDNVRKVAEAEQEAIKRLIKADSELKIVERLKEKRLADYRVELEHQEQKDLDEIAVIKYDEKLHR